MVCLSARLFHVGSIIRNGFLGRIVLNKELLPLAMQLGSTVEKHGAKCADIMPSCLGLERPDKATSDRRWRGGAGLIGKNKNTKASEESSIRDGPQPRICLRLLEELLAGRKSRIREFNSGRVRDFV